MRCCKRRSGLGAAEVGIGGCHVTQALVVAPVVVVLDERLDLGFEIAGQEVVLEQDAVLEGLVPALDLALGLGMERRAADMAHALGFDIFRQLRSDVTWSVVRQKPGLMAHMRLMTSLAKRSARRLQSVRQAQAWHIGFVCSNMWIIFEGVGTQDSPTPSSARLSSHGCRICAGLKSSFRP